jgi:hypothetical protein
MDFDEEPTKPDNGTNQNALMLARLFDQLPPIDQRKLAKLVENWFVAPTEVRILLEELARLLVNSKH